MTARRRLTNLIDQGVIPRERIDEAAALTVRPASAAWWRFIDGLLLALGSLSVAFALLFFIAYNWNDLGRFTKFGLVQVFLVAALIGYCRCAPGTIGAKVSLLIATIGLGVLLALFGQTYQTGADPWQLFFNWALLMLPWALISRFPALWLLWVALINISAVLYHQVLPGGFFGRPEQAAWCLFALNLAALTAWEILALRWEWLRERWAIRLIGVGAGASVTWSVLLAIVGPGSGLLAGPVWAIWLAAMYGTYRKVKPDLFMLAGCCLSVITVVVTFLAEHFLGTEYVMIFLLLTAVVVGMGAGSAIWLKHVQEEVAE